MNGALPDPDPRFVHRLEAFSDIVIAFSLAQSTLSLTIPHRALDVLGKPLGFIAFGATFTIICILWLRHHHWFSEYFVPSRLNVSLNFALLGAIVGLVYSVQLLVHFMKPGTDWTVAFLIYLSNLSLVMLLFGAVYLIGVTSRPRALTADLLIGGYAQSFRFFGAGIAILIGFLFLNAGSPGEIAAGLAFVVTCFALLGRRIGQGVGRHVARLSAFPGNVN
ncbi:MAG: DUF1211 domain-containing protein [Candidatus Eremiobacteraeota bacterium]|nr:DUF1211 domain-containing protein [Candidatus Eremiobacteraeota bacterium]MBV9971938.1 DUF1211 domain-containing protein [Candidatus Eremiobacteraeota bacterium]